MKKSLKNRVDAFRKANANGVLDEIVGHLSKDAQQLDWDSSAQILENQLKECGVNLSEKIYREYKFPDGLKNFEVDKNTRLMRLYIALYENYLQRLKSDGTKSRLFECQRYEYQKSGKTDLASFFGFCISLALSDVKDLQNVFEQVYVEYKEKINNLACAVWQMNPELQNISDYKNVDFINGAIFGFAPAEIDFFIRYDFDTPEREQADKMINKIEAFVQQYVTYVLSPKTAAQILKDIEKYRANSMQMQKFDTGVNR